jgi:uncharacterized protein YkwD
MVQPPIVIISTFIMEQQRAYIINIITVVFVIISITFLWKGGDDFFANMATDENSDDTSVQEIVVTKGEMVTPGPLVSEVPSYKNVLSAASLTGEGIVSETNARRVAHDKKRLVLSEKLSNSAQVKANNILQEQYFDHVSPSGVSVGDLASSAGYEYIRVGENLALGGFTNEADVLNAWMNSEGHRSNILNDTYSDLGVGIVQGRFKGQLVVVIVQHFGRPRSACPAVNDMLRQEIVAGQNSLYALSNSLTNLKAEIDQKKANGEDALSLTTTYNKGVDEYNAQYNSISVKSRAYNAQVDTFNTCISK